MVFYLALSHKNMSRKKTKGIWRMVNAIASLVLVLQPVSAPSILRAMAETTDAPAADQGTATSDNSTTNDNTSEMPKDSSGSQNTASDSGNTNDSAPTNSNGTATTESGANAAAGNKPADSGTGGGTNVQTNDDTAASTKNSAPSNGDTNATTSKDETTSSGTAASDQPTTGQNGKVCLESGANIVSSDKSDWNVNGDTAETKSKIELGVKYVFPLDSKVSVTFTCLPASTDDRTTLKIQRISVSDINLPDGVAAATEYAYDITTGMPNGDFEYDLTLPKGDAIDTEVNYIEKSATEIKNEDLANSDLKTVDDEDVKNGTNNIKISDLDHFTVFVVTKQPSANTNSSGGWSNPDKMYAADNNRGAANNQNDVVELRNFDLSVPTGVTILGVEVLVEGYTGGTRQSAVSLSWNGGTSYTSGAGTGVKTTNLPGTTSSTETVITLGNGTDLWGRSWTAGQFSNTNFRVKLDATTGTGSENLNIDQVRVRVSYDDDVPNCPNPTITEGTHPGEQYVSGNTIYYTTRISGSGGFTVNEAATDANSGIQKVNFPTTVSAGGDDTSSPYSRAYSWSSSDTFSNSATITCYDNSGNAATSTLNVYRDNTLPAVNDVSLDDYSIKAGDSVDIDADVAETGSGIGQCPAYLSTNTNASTLGDTSLGDLGTDCEGTAAINAAAGTYYIKVKPSDNVGLSPDPGISSALVVDNTAPVTADDIADSDWRNSDVTVTLTCNDTGRSGCGTTYHTIDGTDPDTGSSTINPFTISADGEYTVKYFSVDNAGNAESPIVTAANQVKIDKTNPNGSITSPADGSLVRGTITVAADANDIPSGVSKVEFWHASVGTKMGEDTNAPYSIDWDTTAVPDGGHSIWAVVFDNAGNQVLTLQNNVNVDNTTPSVVSASSDGQIYTNATASPQNIEVVFDEDISNTPSIGINPAPVDPQTVTDCGDADAKTFCFDYAIPTGQETTHTIHISGAQDLAGNTMIGDTSHTFVVDTLAPTITINNPDTSWAQSKTISADGGDGTLTQSVTTGDVCDGSLAFEAYAPLTFSSEADNGKKVCYRSEDSVGNVAYSLSNAIAGIDKTNPDFSMTEPADGAKLRGTVPVSADASDSGSGVAFVKFYYASPGHSGTPIREADTSPYTVSWDTIATHVSDDIYDIYAVYSDNAGNSNRSRTVSVTVDNTRPTDPGTPVADVTSPTNQTGITWSWTDSNAAISGLKNYLWNIRQSAANILSGITTGTSIFQDLSSYGDGSFVFSVQAEDNAGNKSNVISSLSTLIETVKPVITLSGASPIDVEMNSAYADAGAMAFDNYDGDITANIVINNPVDTAVLGTYTVTYNVSDRAGNAAAEVTRTVNVVDSTAPDMPTATPPAGDYMKNQSVALSSADSGSGLDSIFFTLDGTMPDNTKTLYVNPILIDKDTTLKAIAYDKVGNGSGVLTAAYGIAPVISAETGSVLSSTRVTITWTTDDPATSRVVYDTVSHPTLGAAPNYGYANSTIEDSAKVKSHSVLVSGLSSHTTYYYRTISHGSPETVSAEQMITTKRRHSRNGGGGNGGGNGGGAATLASAGGAQGAISGTATGGETATGGQAGPGEEQVAAGEPEGQVLGEEQVRSQSGFFGRHKVLSVAGALVLLGLLYFVFSRKKKKKFPELPQNPVP